MVERGAIIFSVLRLYGAKKKPLMQEAMRIRSAMGVQ